MLARTLPFALVAVLIGCSSDDTSSPSGDGDTGISVDSTISDARTDSVAPDTRDAGDGAIVDAPKSDAKDATTTDATDATDATTDDADETTSDADLDADDGASDAAIDTTPSEAGGPCTAGGGECAADQWCDAPDCALGTCQPRPPSASGRLNPICGCDGVTYWNVEVAAYVGASTHAGTGVCEPSRPDTLHCGGTIGPGCSSDESCIVERTGGSCGHADIGGQCWYIPTFATCPGTDPKPMRDCLDSSCSSYCDVLVAGHPFFEDPTCP